MQSRTIATHGGGDLVIGDGPRIEGLIHGWIYASPGARRRWGPYGFMFEPKHGRQLVSTLRGGREERRIPIFAGEILVSHRRSLATLWFYSRGELTPERSCVLYEGAIEAAAAALEEACQEAEEVERCWRQARLTAGPRRAAQLERELEGEGEDAPCAA